MFNTKALLKLNRKKLHKGCKSEENDFCSKCNSPTELINSRCNDYKEKAKV